MVASARDFRILSEPEEGRSPSIALLEPKYAYNVGQVVRLASSFGIEQVWFTGHEVSFRSRKKLSKQRLPREERMRQYRDVTIFNNDSPLSYFTDAVPVAVEVQKNAESLHEFEHPQNAVYIFGPEDGSIEQSIRFHCHRFVIIPTRHCLNLATAVAMVLYDRQLKQWTAGLKTTTPGEFERRGFVSSNLEEIFNDD